MSVCGCVFVSMSVCVCLFGVYECVCVCEPCVCVRIRMAGIKGLQGVVRKTVNDELQANIWDPQHMDKIVPSLLFNLQCGEGTERSALCTLDSVILIVCG